MRQTPRLCQVQIKSALTISKEPAQTRRLSFLSHFYKAVFYLTPILIGTFGRGLGIRCPN